MTKIIHVHLFSGRKNYYFGSISAVYDVLSSEEVGLTKSVLLHMGLKEKGKITTKKGIITQSYLVRSKSKTKR
jgi:hypothetical protein